MKFFKFIYNNRLSYSVLVICIRFIDLILPIRRNLILFHGYSGRYVGNAKVLFQYIKKKGLLSLKPIWLLDERDGSLFYNCEAFKFTLPDRNSRIISHVKLLLLLVRARVIVTTSIGDIYPYRNLLSKSKHLEVLLFNGTSLKMTGVMAKHLQGKKRNIWRTVPKRFDLISVCSRLERYIISSGFNFPPENIEVIGPQRRDIIYNDGNKEICRNKKKIICQLIDVDSKYIPNLILYAPTHRDHKNIIPSHFGMLSKLNDFDYKILNAKLIELNSHILLRDHIEVPENPNRSNEIETLSNIHNFSNEIIADIDDVINGFDVIITDYSGIYLDLLDRHQSLAFIPYDLAEYEELRGLCLPYDILAAGPILKNQDQLLSFLENRKKIDGNYASHKAFLSKLFFEVPAGSSCEMTKAAIEARI